MIKLKALLSQTNSTYSLYDLMKELSTWITFPRQQLNTAKELNITVSTNKDFKNLVDAWQDGEYDEDIEALEDQVFFILNNRK